jgi:predicted DNA-binding transcriptional regulator AlpA
MKTEQLHAYNTVRDLTGYFRISKSTFYSIVAAGLTPSFYIGSSPRWSADDITGWIIVQTEKSKTKVDA